MYDVIHDRVFWIYFVVTFFFIVIGISSIVVSNNSALIAISIFWLLSSIALMIIVYQASIRWGPKDPFSEYSQICIIDTNSGCFDAGNRVWLFINLLFLALLIISVLWAAELGNSEAGPLRSMSGVLILLGGLLMARLAITGNIYFDVCTIHFWIAVSYILIWFGLTLYVILAA